MVKRFIAVLLAFFAAVAVSASAFAAADAKVDVNTGSQAELESVKGIGPTMSTKLLTERKKGAFKNWSDLVERVPGIGDKSAGKLSNAGLTVGGSAFSRPAVPTTGTSGKKMAKGATPAAASASAGKTKM